MCLFSRACTGTLFCILRFTNRFHRPMRKAINTQKKSTLGVTLIIIGLQRYCFFVN